MNEFEEDNDLGDEDIDSHSQIRLVEAINRLDKTQHIKKPSRSGISDIKSEFHVGKSGPEKKILLKDIIKTLKQSTEYGDIGKKLSVTQKKENQVLNKPLEKHKAEKIKRATGFDEVKKKLGRWDAVVSRNRSLDHQTFPLETNVPSKQPVKDYLSKFKLKSDLEKDLDVLKPVEEDPVEEKFPLTMQEMIEHRKEAAKLRARQSYKEAKARRQSKIKSKKYHRILRKAKIKQQIKEFEILQKTDPEEALKKLEQLEKSRAEERITLRHKSTGQWAKNKLVRAKYDKETRQELSQQLSISRELTQKLNYDNDSQSDDQEENGLSREQDPSNPWLQDTQHDNDSELIGGYKKYWDELNALKKNQNEQQILEESSAKVNVLIDDCEIIGKSESNSVINKTSVEKVTPVSKKRKLKQKVVQSTSEWEIESVEIPTKLARSMGDTKEKNTVGSIFEDLEYKMQTKLAEKLKSFKNKESDDKIISDNTSKPGGKYIDLGFKKKKLKPIIDEELHETSRNVNNENTSYFGPIELNTTQKVDSSNEVNKVDPNIFVGLKPRHLQSGLPDMEAEGDHLDDEDLKTITIAEAFEDDDIVAEFQQEKQNDIEKNKPQIENLDLPGWGSWVGKNLTGLPKRKRKRTILNLPKQIPRVDDNKHNVIINESKESKLRAHQVSELPFPFTSVKDFECSIRAPLGNTFIPETAHRKLTKPAVKVKTGIIIDPMDDSQLISSKSSNKKSTLKLMN